jgi:hypothetical protein
VVLAITVIGVDHATSSSWRAGLSDGSNAAALA